MMMNASKNNKSESNDILFNKETNGIDKLY